MDRLDEDWDFSAEELELLEQDAFRKIAERKLSSATAGSSCCSPSVSHLSPPASASIYKPCQAPPSRTSLESRYDNVEVPSGLLDDNSLSTNDLPQLSVRLYLHSTGLIAAKFSYSPILVQAVHKVPKASWRPEERLWLFPLSSLKTAEHVFSGVSGANVELQSLDPLACRAIVCANAAPDLSALYDRIPSYLESKLLPFQREGVRFVLQHGGRALLADEMGLGKTLQALAVASSLGESWPVLVLTPSSLRLHWASMIHQWLGIPAGDILVVLSQAGSTRGGFKIVFSSQKLAIRLDGTFNIVSYDSVPKLQNVLLSSAFKIVIADESHFLKNGQAKRTSASLPILQKAQYAILLSGTPALSRPIELFKQLEALHPEVYRSVHEYGNRYCKGGVFGLYQGASNHDELHSLMKGTVMIRRLKNDVLLELPVKRRQQVFLDLNEKDLKETRALFRELEVIKSKIQTCTEENLKALKFTQKNLISKIYNHSAEAKIPAVLDYLSTVIEADCKFLVFAHHLPMIEAMHQFFLKKKVGCIRIDGSTPATSRQALVTQFQENSEIKAAVLSILAGGVGINLTAASTVIFAELSWTPGDLIQAEDRVHRIGQVTSVNIYYLLANETVDDIIWDVVQSKLENLGQVLDGEENTLEVACSQTMSSPAKQKTLDSFLKRCPSFPTTSPKTKILKY
ncbi:SWI/SNF-related matrix-associated actin-dependent regulator of chromatin subfamily A-like protein 1 isoform X2 [Phalaenopsis equestris]|uniref:SWI/SNF-related matrix-associated actin-dependent regulator of chromatin subfamily A-like protein 1 isoform X2 n=1 Tax=Phalaenopsis equestris TaxID=78828 RepID=UPI0009E36768|nr:SWI/SNF-related matrix-associated actin-dependent regulator of chromatin subfamily A-like protein 1 isoform X2 [Phalaenopsis equestris]